MTLTPVFKIALWNAWILMLIALLPQIILMILDSTRGKGELFTKKMGEAPAEKREKIKNNVATGLYYALIASTIFLPLKPGTLWIFFGLLAWMLGLFILISALATVVTTPMGCIFARGVYRFSRHPLYLSMMLIFLGIGLSAASWPFLLGVVVYSALLLSNAVKEEQNCPGTFGTDYERYMDQTPRWLGIPKSEKNNH